MLSTTPVLRLLYSSTVAGRRLLWIAILVAVDPLIFVASRKFESTTAAVPRLPVLAVAIPVASFLHPHTSAASYTIAASYRC